MYDIAQEAGVSPATVSRVLTGSARVSKAKKERIEALIKRYDFKPNALARGLSETKSNIIGMIVADIRNPFYATVFLECEKVASRYGYTLMVCNTLGEPELEDIYLEKMYEQRVDAIINVGGRVDDLVSNIDFVDHVNRIANVIPVIITGKLDGSDCYRVNIDQMQAMEIVMEYIISLGHKDIALIGGRDNVQSTVDKRSRYKQLLKRYGINVRNEFIVEGKRYDDESGYECMQKLFALEKLPTAIIAINDFTAVGAMRALTERGISVPEDVSIVSFDNTFIAEVTSPKLTSVSYSYENFGEKIVHAALGAIRGEEVPRIQLIQSELVIRGSCAKLNIEE
ncbi:MAG: LacI family transcriptional regulator [Clostridiales bacterium]|nr:LacI family transcriptional regulator [Clostridiales bacterium]